MSLINQLTQQLSGPALEALSGQIGADQESTSNAITAALPLLMGQMAKQSQGGGTNGIMSMIDADGDGNIMDDLVGFLGTTENGPAAGILSNLFGGNQGNMENGISKMSGLNSQQSGQLLANLAPIVMGFLSKQKQQNGLDENGLADMLNQEKNNINQAAQENPLMDMANKFLDADGDGSILDDIANMASGKSKGGLGGLIGGLFGGK
ncbi:MAG: DUF937 domain-containing protein [Bacteroidia bacterium]|nr:DUF937 domain-containing protein [Bacteroidia bacterium]